MPKWSSVIWLKGKTYASLHLRLLKDAGMVTEQARGTRRIYHLHEQGMQAVQAYLEGIWGEAAVRFRLLAENTDQAPDR